jgi:uncharacterized protein
MKDSFNQAANDNAPNPDRELLRAAEGNDLPKVKFWLKKGANIDARHTNNDTPLIIAAREGHEEVARYLLHRQGKKADSSLQNNQGETAMIASLLGGSVAIATLILQTGAPTHARDEDGATVVFHAANFGYDKLIDALARGKADLNAPDHKKTTPLMQAIKARKHTSAAALLQNEAGMDLQDAHGMTALMHAILNEGDAVSQALIGLGANLELKNSDGKTAMDLARIIRKDAIVTQIKGKLAEIYSPYHTGTANKVTPMKPLTFRSPGENA